MRRKVLFGPFAILLGVMAREANAQGCTPTNYSASDVAQAIQNSPNANNTLKTNSCNFGGAARSESGGNLCSQNTGNSGILQLNNRSIQAANLTPGEYMNLPLQRQVDIWAQQVGNGNTSSTGYQAISSAISGGGSIGGVKATPGMAAACFQFGPVICNNDVASLQSGGSCEGSGIRCTNSSCNGGTASLDGNGQSICSWGNNIQSNINKAAAGCTNADCSIDNIGDFPSGPVPQPTTDVATG
jgi:hypothetical protein